VRPRPRHRHLTLLVIVLAVLATGGPLVSMAPADGDPASDYLVANPVFLAAQSGSPSAAQRRLLATVAAANRAGFTIRVATIPQPYDLGSVTALWRRPQLYARFLGLELASAYRGRLLVAMPNGIGLSRAGRSLSEAGGGHGGAADATPDALASRARAVVVSLARAAGVTLTVGPRAIASAGQTAAGAGPLPWIAAACALIALATLAVGLARRRARWAVPGIGALGVIAFGVAILLVVTVRDRNPPAPPAAGAVPSATENAAATAAAPPPVQWPAAVRPAPDFALHDQAGRPVSMSRLRGRTVLVTFVDPLCRNLCPLEAHVLNAAVAALPRAGRPAILAVSTDVYADARRFLRQDVRRWSLVPEWHWAVGSPAALAAVWRHYRVGVSVVTRRIGTTTVREVTHAELAYVVDPSGHERALFVWPFGPRDVVRELRRLS
jgi:cytochrome oxidase Cu insertion factor (SCO1/SenC/PrrC family)